jgi:hypothetical protein
MTHYTMGATSFTPAYSQYDVNFAISVGIEYKFNKKR